MSLKPEDLKPGDEVMVRFTYEGSGVLKGFTDISRAAWPWPKDVRRVDALDDAPEELRSKLAEFFGGPFGPVGPFRFIFDLVVNAAKTVKPMQEQSEPEPVAEEEQSEMYARLVKAGFSKAQALELTRWMLKR